MSTELTSLNPPVHNPPHDTSGAASGAICGQVQPPRALANKVDLWLTPSAKLPRRLHVELSAYGYLYVHVYAKGYGHLSGAGQRFNDDCYLDISTEYLFLSVGNATFPLSASEVTKLRTVLEPHGLRIRETNP